MPKRDIETREDIHLFLERFYSRTTKDPVIGIFFTEVVPLNIEAHLPVITDFWESILLDNPVYKKNAMAVHDDINSKYKMLPQHFEAWLQIFNTTIDEMYSGNTVELAKKRASGIAGLMELRMNNKK